MGYSEPTTSPSRGSLPMPNDPSLVLPSWLVLPMEMNSQTKFLKTVKTFVCWAYLCIKMGLAPSCNYFKSDERKGAQVSCSRHRTGPAACSPPNPMFGASGTGSSCNNLIRVCAPGLPSYRPQGMDQFLHSMHID
ncbi:hypothetical protein Q3G72_015431 [Acer saccharum]|nr:hypothetical protein Q3G72_015431 [Acer saccharum]